LPSDARNRRSALTPARVLSLLAVLTACAALLAVVTSAGADDPAPGAGSVEQPLCVAPDGTVHVAPSGTPGGEPLACPAGYPPQDPQPAAQPAAEQPQAPASQPAGTGGEAAPAEPAPPAPAPPAPSPTDPKTEAPGNATVEPQAIEPGDGIERDAEPKLQKRSQTRTVEPADTGKDDGADKDAKDAAPTGGVNAPAVDDSPLVLAPPAPARAVPNILLDRFQIPPFLLPLYQAAGVQYGVRWEILAAINSIETDYGRNLSVSSAGAVGWMQFMPATWEMYGVDANGDGRKDPYNPVDAIFAAARYLKAAGAGDSLRRAIFAYNHADWYVNDVIGRASAISELPDEVVASLAGLTLGRFPIAARASYAGRVNTAGAKVSGRNASQSIEGDGNRRGMRVYAAAGSPVVAVQDGVVAGMGETERLGKFVRLRDAYGNRYVYGHLAKIAATHPVPRERHASSSAIRRELGLDRRDAKPSRAATAGRRGHDHDHDHHRGQAAKATAAPANLALAQLLDRPRITIGHVLSGGLPPGISSYDAWFTQPYTLDPKDVKLEPLRKGSHVIGGTILGRVGRASLRREGATSSADARAERSVASAEGVARAPHLWFEVRPAGSVTPRVDPKPILDGWRLLDATKIYGDRSAIVGGDGEYTKLTAGQVLLMSKEQLIKHVLANPRIRIYACGRQDIQAGVVDRRVLALLAFLVTKGMDPTVTSLRCGHGYYTKSGNVSEHTFGSAVDIAAINGTPIYGHQGKGSITDKAVRAILTLQGTMKAHQIITLMQYSGTDNTYAMADHADHIHVGFDPRESAATSILRPGQWDRLIGSLSRVPNPVVPLAPSAWSIAVEKHAMAGANGGDAGR
jgi:murein DD-endopeptidase MepM/ murein hydrolase activator NlpD